MNNYFLFFSDCFLVNGAKESIIVDTGRNCFLPIDIIVYQVFMVLLTENITIDELKKRHGNEFNDGIDKYIEFFIENELGFLTSIPESFPKIDLVWDSPFPIITGGVEFGINSDYSIQRVIKVLLGLGCQNLQIRIPSPKVLDRILEALVEIKDSRLKGAELLVHYSSKLTKKRCIEILDTFPRIVRMIIYNSPENFFLKQNTSSITNRIFFFDKIT